MTYTIFETVAYLDDIRSHVAYLREQHVPEHVIEEWFQGLFDRVGELSQMPKRYAVDAIQTPILNTETRKLVYGKYLVFFQIDENQKVIHVVGFYHSSKHHEDQAPL